MKFYFYICCSDTLFVLYSLPQVEDPSCFWLAVKECVPGVVSEIVYENLKAEMKQFYNNYQDADEIKRDKIEKGQVRLLLYIEIIYSLHWFRGEVSNTCFVCCFFLFLHIKIVNSISVGCVFSSVSLLTV